MSWLTPEWVTPKERKKLFLAVLFECTSLPEWIGQEKSELVICHQNSIPTKFKVQELRKSDTLSGGCLNEKHAKDNRHFRSAARDLIRFKTDPYSLHKETWEIQQFQPDST